jgi:cyclopropane-fatty-acyl-phospholipid synthase
VGVKVRENLTTFMKNVSNHLWSVLSQFELQSSKLIIDWILRRSWIVIGKDIEINDSRFYPELLLRGSLWLGEAYMKWYWISDNVRWVVEKILSSGIYQKLWWVYNLPLRTSLLLWKNPQSKEWSREVIDIHYNLPSEFYEKFLDQGMQYTCAYFENWDETLEEAQRKKMRLICDKLGLRNWMQVLDMWWWWWGLVNFMQVEYDVKPTVVTLSSEQAEYMRNHFPKIKVIESDYRDLQGSGEYDRVSAIWIFEHIWHRNYRDFMQIFSSQLKEEGELLVHTLFTPYEKPATNPWLDKYIFPNWELPPVSMIEESALPFFHKTKSRKYPHFQELTPSYPKTLWIWDQNLQKALEEESIILSDEEKRKWHFYFSSCAWALASNHMKVWQFHFSKK